jgi:hypothetical protein
MTQAEARIALAASLRQVNTKLRAKALVQPRDPATGRFVGRHVCPECHAPDYVQVFREWETPRQTLWQRIRSWFGGDE